MKNKTVKLRICDQEWTFKLISTVTYKKKHGEDSDGITMPAEKTCEFDKNSLDVGVVIHELGHVYYDCCSTESAGLDANQVEEVFCTIIQNHFIDILKNAYEIMSIFTRQDM